MAPPERGGHPPRVWLVRPLHRLRAGLDGHHGVVLRGRAAHDSEVSVSPDGGSAANLAFTVNAVGVGQNTHVLAFVSWVRNSKNEPQQTPLFMSTLRPDDRGLVDQKVTVHLTRPGAPHSLRLQVYRVDDANTAKIEQRAATAAQNPQAATRGVPKGASCGDQADQRTAPACTEIMVPGRQPQ